MNKHIALVKKWLADSDSVTSNELEANLHAAASAASAAQLVDVVAYMAYMGDVKRTKDGVAQYKRLMEAQVYEMRI